MASETEFDIIFAGGGAAACVTAGRLAAADPSLRILIVEAGPHTQEDPAHVQPARYLSHLVPGSKTVKFLVSNPSPHLGGRPAIVPAGQCIGGGSSVNFVMYNRGVPSEYDAWETQFENPGWGSKDIVPLLAKSETYEIDPLIKTRGSTGPLKVSLGGYFPKLAQDFLDTASAYDKDRKVVLDSSDPSTVNSYGRWPKWIGAKTGHRSDVAHHYIYPEQEKNKNLRIVTGYYVKRVIVENERAVGIEYTPSPQFHPDASPKLLTAHASKLVVVAGGSLGSPLILERSGIGAASLLEKHGIKKVVDLPGVGERYQDHQLLAPLFHASEDSGTLDEFMRGEPSVIEKWGAQWIKDGSGMVATNGIDVGIKYRPTEDEVLSIGPAFQQTWRDHFANYPDRSVVWMGLGSFCFGGIPAAPKGPYFTVGLFLNHPSSVGHIHITSGDDATAAPDFHPGYLEHEEDFELLVYAYKRARELARRMAGYRGDFSGNQPQFAKDSKAAISEESKPVAADAPDLVYSKEDDEAIREWIRKTVSTTWHALGTCAMMPREKGGVVDHKLNVYGVKGLKVADLSIAPRNVGANTYSTACAIGEKAAIIIAEELGISGV
ncbi:alcohol oxidase-like protein [Cristinia sonorae]|uniref:Alcohol oxidase-like protein n=1 Tax=Cristinia sonorae TaxID=1940300 RepID=A0A8K0XSL8_9AGAR|nr:alcohol oxidase-like protein [Cristinia sonorae]